MQVQIGRFGTDVPVDAVATARRSGQGLTLSGTVKCQTLEDLAALRAQCNGLANNVDEPVVPVIVEGTRSTYWRVASVSWDEGEGAYDGLFTADWSVDLDSIAARDAALMEARLLLASTITGEPVTLPWTAIPAQATGWTPLPAMTSVGVTDRVAESGTVRIFTEAALADARTQWRQRAEDAYAGAASILAGDTGLASPSPSGPALPGATTYTTWGSHSYTVPAGVDVVRVVAVGGRGGTAPYGARGGSGAQVTCDLAVTPGEVLTVTVAGDGRNGTGWPTGASYAGGGGAGGYNGGGKGGDIQPSTTGFWSGGGGGGGATDVRQGGTTVADRVVVAAGGGGATWAWGGTAGTVNGYPGEWGDFAGKGGTSSGPGDGGAGGFSTLAEGEAGDTDGLGQGGDGGSYLASNLSGGGGGGAGLHGGGGGGCVGSPDGSSIKASSGGAGSSLTTGVNDRVDDSGWGAPQVQIAPVITAGVGTPPDSVNYRAIVNRQILADPFGWMVSNGIVRVRPCYSATEIGLCVQTWTGTSWGVEHTFGIFRWAASTYQSADSVATSVTVLRNAPEAVAIRVGYADNSHVDQHTVDISLRRGSRVAEVNFTTTSTDDWAIRHDPADAATAYGVSGATVLGIYGTTPDADGDTWMICQWIAGTSVDVTNGGCVVDGSYHSIGLGVALPTETTGQLSAAFSAAGAETVRVIAS